MIISSFLKRTVSAGEHNPYRQSSDFGERGTGWELALPQALLQGAGGDPRFGMTRVRADARRCACRMLASFQRALFVAMTNHLKILILEK